MVLEVLMLEILLLSCFQVAHIPGALFFDVDGISDKTSSVSSDLLLTLYYQSV
jgi:3-mercaptopyruvate sulfurtransferase SseA